ncbi:MAG: aminotransferase class I/II-fold pyridoxal phosphate-dependent enzyme [Sphingomonadales bacterium]|nr:aminotransferase class I/II-fold pyridoxal phosphate-dependent enzyme [Sphingomonadales bacterium]
MDLLEKLKNRRGPLGIHAKEAEGYYMFPKLEGEIAATMKFRGKDRLVWSLNNYLGLANHPEVRAIDAETAAQFGLAYPMGARMMSGNSNAHEQLEQELAEFVGKPAGLLVNYGYQGIVSAIDALLDRHDIVIYDAESHACIVDGVRLHQGQRYMFRHNDMASLETQLQRAVKLIAGQGNQGGVLVITEGVFGMTGVQGDLKGVVALKSRYPFRLLVDDAHGFGTMGATGGGTAQEQGVTDQVDIYFSTFAKSMASIGAFFASDAETLAFLKYNMRSQIFAKSLPMPLVLGAIRRLELIRKHPEYKEKLWTVVRALQDGLKARGFSIGITSSPVTPVMLNGTLGEATSLVVDLREHYGIFCSVVVYPVVPKGVILLRLIPTAAHSLDDVERTLNAFSEVAMKLKEGHYTAEGVVDMKS